MHAALGVSIFTFVIFMRDMGRLLELLVRNSAPVPSIAELFFLTLPTALNLTIPMGVLVGILIGLSRLAADSEVTAMRASGVGSLAMVGMTSIFVVAAWLAALANSLYLAPRSASALVHLQDSLKSSQASFAVQPRVFYENFPNTVLYVQDSVTGSGAAAWRNVFLADVRNAAAPRITIAQSALVVNEQEGSLRLHLVKGAQHENLPRSPGEYNISTFDESDIPIELPVNDSLARREPPAAELKTADLIGRAADSDPVKARWFLIEFHRRLALPSACLVLALVGIPLGLSSRKGGKSTGFVLTIILVFAYYIVSLAGIAMARQGKVSPGIGVWMANLVFAFAGIVLLRRVDHSFIDVGSVRGFLAALRARFRPARDVAEMLLARETPAKSNSWGFPLILDGYVLRGFVLNLSLVLAAFTVLTLVFTFFELISDIIRNRVPLVTVGEYLVNVLPYMIDTTMPLSVLIAVLITFSMLQHSSELTAMKASGVSIYRVIVPVLVVALVLSAGLFVFEQTYLPEANTRQEALRNAIKGRPAQTVLRPDRQWIFGQHNVIYYYEHFDPDRNEFANFAAFEFDPATFAITRRVAAARVHWSEGVDKWVFENGWWRDFSGDRVTEFKTFDVRSFEAINEPPAYFKKEVRLSSEMDYGELRRYISDLQQSGFDVVRLRVQLHRKLAFPMVVFVMALLAVPFAMSAGRKGPLTGVAVALGMAIVYWISNGLFEQLGNLNQLPPLLAAWAPALLFGLTGTYLLFRVRT